MTKHFWLPLAAAALTAGTASAQRPLVPGEITRGSLSTADLRSDRGSYYDAYTFQGRRGETVIVQMESRDFDSYLHLGTERRGGWRELAYDDDGGDGRNSRIQLTLPDDGTYVVRASSLSRSTGQYTLTLSGGDDDAWDEPSTVQPVRPRRRDGDGYVRAGERIEGYLSSSDPRLDNGEPFHLYTYSGRRGERLTLTLRSRDFDSYLVLGTAGGRHGVGNALARDDDGGGDRDSRIDFTLPSDGDYVIRVNPLASGSGAYTLDVQSDLQGGYDRPGRDDDYDSGYDDGRGLDRRLIGRWGLVVPGVRVDPQSWTSVSANAGFGYLDVSRDGTYTWSRNGRTRRGTLEPFTPPRRGEQGGRYYRITDGREDFYISFTAYRAERYMQVNSAATGQVVAYGYVDPGSR